MAVRGVALFVAFALASAPVGALAGDRSTRADSNCCRWSRRALGGACGPRAGAAAGLRKAVRRLLLSCSRVGRAERRRRRGRLSRAVSVGGRRALLPAREFRSDRRRRRCARRTLFRPARRLPLSLGRRAGLRLPQRRRAGARLLARPDAEERRRCDDRRRDRHFPRRRRRRPLRRRAFTPVDSAPLGATRRAEFGALAPAIAPDAPEVGAPTIGEARRRQRGGGRDPLCRGPGRRRRLSGGFVLRRQSVNKGAATWPALCATGGGRAWAAREVRSDKRGCVAA